MPGPNAFRKTKGSGSQAARGKDPPPKLIKRPRMGIGSVSQPASSRPSAQGFVPTPAAVNEELEAAGFTPFGFRSSSRNSNPGQSYPGSRPGSGNPIRRPISRQRSIPNPQAHGAPIQVFAPDQDEGMQRQGLYRFEPYRQPEYYGPVHPRHLHSHSQPDGQFFSRHHQAQYDDQFDAQYSQPEPQYLDRYRSQNSQSLPADQIIDQMNRLPDGVNFNEPREVHSADFARQLPLAEIVSPAIPPKRIPMKEYIASVRKGNTPSLEAEDVPTDNVRGSNVDTDARTTHEAPTRKREPIQRPASETRRPKESSRVEQTLVPKPVPAGQDKPKGSDEQSIVEEKHEAQMVTRSRAKRAIGDQPHVSHDRNNHDSGTPERPMASLSAPATEKSPQQPPQVAQSKRSVATATDPCDEQPPRKKLKEVSKKEFQRLLEADDLMSIALEKGTTSPVALEAAILGKIMANDEKFAEYVDMVLTGVD
ncbi:uncharacterized protein PG986_011876 [Apiospora aurea]|uniref:Uncharacterized protein n=1 Tax=Apiospora aurea TaxID=335848 RepID=A0ABR1PYC7_9PEZI